MATVEIFDGIGPLVPEWERLAHRTQASPFLWPGWVEAWWQALGAGRLHIIAVYEDGQLTGVLPMQRRFGTLSLIPATHTPLSGFLASNDLAAKHLSHAVFSLKPRCINFSYISPADIGTSWVFAEAEGSGYRVLEKSIPVAETVPYVATDGPLDVYENSLRRKFRSEIRRRRRRLEERGQLTLEIADGSEGLDELLEEGFRIEASGWKGDYGTSINSRPALRRFYIEVARWAAERDWLRLAFLRIDGQAVAFDLCLEHNQVHYLVKTGYDPAFRKFGTGMILRYMMITRAFSSGIATYDFCGEDWTWKREWTSTVQERRFLRAFAPTLPGYLDRLAFVYGRPLAENTVDVARSALGEHGRHVLKRGRAMVRARLKR